MLEKQLSFFVNKKKLSIPTFKNILVFEYITISSQVVNSHTIIILKYEHNLAILLILWNYGHLKSL